MNWTIIGCGWLGTDLAKSLLQNGNAVIGTCTSREKQIVLKKKGINSIVFNSNSQFSAEIIDFSEIVVLSIPPFNRNKPTDYANYLVQIIKQFKLTTQFIFLGSTGIYPNRDGHYNEDYAFEQKDQKTVLHNAENELHLILKERLTILRLGGLFGEDRHPVYHLAGKKNLQNPVGKVNLVDKKDIILIIQELVKKKKLGQIYNIVFPDHPTREEYYVDKAKSFKIKPPTFNDSNSIVREISSKKVQIVLNYTFQHRI